MYRDPVDGSVYELNQPRWRSEAGNPLWIEPGPGIQRSDLDMSNRSIWRYRAALPLEIADPITLGEGFTPLLGQPWAQESQPYFKLDFLNPTGSFKDRGTSVMLSYLRAHGVRSVVEDSSGNGGASVAGYGAAGGLRVKILAPSSTSSDKIAQARAFGADVQLVAGPREESQHEAIEQAHGEVFYASHNWQAFFLQGTKTLAYELWEDLGFKAPENVIVPVGAGSSLLGCWLGFRELLNAGQIDRIDVTPHTTKVAQGGLGDQRGGVQVVLNFGDRPVGVDDPEVTDRVDARGHVVAGDHFLGRDVERDRAQVHADHAVDDRDEQDQARPLQRHQTPEPEDDPALVLTKDADR